MGGSGVSSGSRPATFQPCNELQSQVKVRYQEVPPGHWEVGFRLALRVAFAANFCEYRICDRGLLRAASAASFYE